MSTQSDIAKEVANKMGQFLGCYLGFLNNVPRNSLHDRRNRKQMVEYINTLILGCAGANDNNTELICREALNTLIEYHDNKKSSNGRVCMMGNYHNVLYVAMKLCYLWQIKDGDLVCRILHEIYKCEQTFERIIIGALFGTKAPHYIAGWKSDFEDQEENLKCVVYFLDKSNIGKLELPFQVGNQLQYFRFIDLPIESCGKVSALKVCLQLGLSDKLLIFLRFGAKPIDDTRNDSLFEEIMNRLMECRHSYPYNLLACLQLLIRVVPRIIVNGAEGYRGQNLTKHVIEERYGDLVADGIIPQTRAGYVPSELKHLCRCSIRDQLWKHFGLPHGIRKLPLPEQLLRYLDILED